MHCFSCLTVAIFRKSLRMRALNIASTGYIVNLMSVDAGSAIERAVMMSFPLVTGIPTLVACFWLLYNQVGLQSGGFLSGPVSVDLSVPSGLS